MNKPKIVTRVLYSEESMHTHWDSLKNTIDGLIEEKVLPEFHNTVSISTTTKSDPYDDWEYSLFEVTYSDRETYEEQKNRLDEAAERAKALKEKDLADFKMLAKKLNMKVGGLKDE